MKSEMFIIPVQPHRIERQIPSKSFQVPETSFQEMLQKSLAEVNSLQQQADQLSVRLAAGDNVELHQVMMTAEKAQLALQLTVQIRNKVVEAYQEIMRMQI